MDEFLEALASIEHEQWVHWASGLLKVEPNLSTERVARWKRLMVPYDQLPEDVKEVDRMLARKVVAAIETFRPSTAMSVTALRTSRQGPVSIGPP